MTIAITQVESHYHNGQRAAIRGCYRVLCDAPDDECFAAWYRGYDSVPANMKNQGPLTGPIPQGLLNQLAEVK